MSPAELEEAKKIHRDASVFRNAKMLAALLEEVLNEICVSPLAGDYGDVAETQLEENLAVCDSMKQIVEGLECCANLCDQWVVDVASDAMRRYIEREPAADH